ncbi:MAG TPA: hypothetical protein VFE38_02125 [Edaphobacter sp.]|nr:hypothetical protein [Edaphobacter sp.]
MLSLDVLAVLIFFSLFFLPYCLIGFSGYLITSDRTKLPERSLETNVSRAFAEKSDSNSGTATPEDRARDNPSPMKRSAQPAQHVDDSPQRFLAMGKICLSASLNNGLTTAPTPAQHDISVAKMRLFVAKHHVSGLGLHNPGVAIRHLAGIDFRRR